MRQLTPREFLALETEESWFSGSLFHDRVPGASHYEFSVSNLESLCSVRYSTERLAVI